MEKTFADFFVMQFPIQTKVNSECDLVVWVWERDRHAGAWDDEGVACTELLGRVHFLRLPACFCIWEWSYHMPHTWRSVYCLWLWPFGQKSAHQLDTLNYAEHPMPSHVTLVGGGGQQAYVFSAESVAAQWTLEWKCSPNGGSRTATTVWYSWCNKCVQDYKLKRWYYCKSTLLPLSDSPFPFSPH